MSCMCHAAAHVLSAHVLYWGGGFLVSMCAAVRLSLQMVLSGRGWEVLWCLLRGDFLYFWSYPEEVEQSKVGPACDV